MGTLKKLWLPLAILYLLPQEGPAQDLNRFTLLDPARTGVSFNNFIKDDRDRNILTYANFYGGAGVGVGDFNNDGLQDLYFAGNTVPDKLYINQGNLVFKDMTMEAGIADDGGWSTGVTVADVDNDGDLDIYVSRELYDSRPDWRTNLLYLNNGDGTFVESAAKMGVADSQRTRHATFLDYDKDGFLDLFLLTQPPNPASYSIHFGETLLKPEYHLKLFRNLEGKGFEDVSKVSGIDLTGFPNGVSASDLNDDGWTDLYVANDFAAPDFLFLNNRDGTFTNVMDKALAHIPFYSMGVDVADINNDALLDIFVVDMVAEDNFRLKSNMSGMNPQSFWKVVEEGGHYQYMYNTVQLNNGNMTFSDIAQFTGMAATDWSWSNLLADLDNDGLKDAYVTNGLLHDIRNTDADKAVAAYMNKATNDYLAKHPDGGNLQSIWDIVDLEKVVALIPSQPLKNFAFKNMGNLEFNKVMDTWGLDQKSFSNGSAYADLDNDGDLDLAVNNINQEAFIYRNNSETFTGANYLRLKLGSKKNGTVLGSRAYLYINGDTQMQELTNVRGIYSTSEQMAHFGMGAHTTADSLQIVWPDGSRTSRKNVSANQVLELFKEDGKDEKAMVYDAVRPLFKEDAGLIPRLEHTENAFDDYGQQVLLPHKMSQMGPALAVGDINNDRLEDLYIGGASGYPGQLYIQDNSGAFLKKEQELWDRDKGYEDVDALFFDVNGDGSKDLYVVSGGNEYAANDSHYIDRLYLNDGNGNFSKGAIMEVDRTSGAKVVAGDYDGDGDLDLFVGGRHLPWQYPMPASSMLLQNNNGQLLNVTEALAPDLKNIGMVTDALWSDYDGDGDLDLVLVGEWMPVTLLENVGGKFVKATVPELTSTTGWWFSIEKGDFDNDGDEDFVLGNLGLNYKYKTSKETPFDIYYNDFDQNGRYDIVLGYYNGDKHYPLRGFSCSSQQIPGLKQEFKKYDLFASLELDEVYGEKELDNSLHYMADTFASVYMENLGDGKFAFTDLPYLAQLSNISDMVVDDFNGDGNMDVVAVNNWFVSEIETPRNDAGTGSVLLGDGKGGFTALSGRQSGFWADGDARKTVPITLKNKKGILVANNNAKIEVFSLLGE
ncbi:MAG: VCBS repeat-containing protein [Sediminicola sp.]